eukprot:2405264-Rhodomonas_salina.1
MCIRDSVCAVANDGTQPIHYAAGGGHVECVEWLKEAGADVCAVDNDGDKPVDVATLNGHEECAAWLKEAMGEEAE